MKNKALLSKYDYIVIGAGSSGCVVASRLSEDKRVHVLLIEAGGDDKSWKIDMPLGMEALVKGSRFNWQYQTAEEPHLDGRKVDHPRGKVLGGSSSINGMVYTRGHALDYNGWEKNYGCKGWGYEHVLPYFKRSENFLGGATDYRGVGGPLYVTRPDITKTPLNNAFVAAGGQAGYAITKDSNGYQQEGFGANECTIAHGKRCSSARAFLSEEVRQRPNLEIITDGLAQKLLIQEKKAYGVRVNWAGTEHDFYARKEIVLSAGVFGSPQLLMMSGIGPKSVLDNAGVPVLHELNGVGQNLQDHPDVIVQYDCISPVGLGKVSRIPGKLLAGVTWFASHSGPCASNQFESAAYIRSKAGIQYPDLKLELIGLAYSPEKFEPYPGYSFQIHISHLRPDSRGEVTIVSGSASDKAVVRFNYLSTEYDREVYRNAIRLTREVISQAAFNSYRGEEISPGRAIQTDDEIDQWVKKCLATAYHPVGTCRMGPADDDNAVVTPDLRVRGIHGLRIADASIMPTVVAANTNAPSIMIGERAADFIRDLSLSAKSAPFYVNPNWNSMQR